jgi:hypothetical protein
MCSISSSIAGKICIVCLRSAHFSLLHFQTFCRDTTLHSHNVSWLTLQRQAAVTSRNTALVIHAWLQMNITGENMLSQQVSSLSFFFVCCRLFYLFRLFDSFSSLWFVLISLIRCHLFYSFSSQSLFSFHSSIDSPSFSLLTFWFRPKVQTRFIICKN